MIDRESDGLISKTSKITIERLAFEHKTSAFGVQRHAYTATGYYLYDVTDPMAEVYLGFIPEGSTVLTGISLADGNHVIEIRTSRYFWDQARSLQKFNISVSGGAATAVGLPLISDVSVSTQSGYSKISWTGTSDGIGLDAAGFKLWFSTTSPVDTTGTPDAYVPWTQGFSSYQYSRITTGAQEYCAIASYSQTPATVGPASEVVIPWVAAPIAPPNQAVISSIPQ
jgi:hypothetical protein